MLSILGKKKVAEFKASLEESEALILQTLKGLGLTYEEFILLTSSSSQSEYLN
jgi:hypothetical protein